MLAFTALGLRPRHLRKSKWTLSSEATSSVRVIVSGTWWHRGFAEMRRTTKMSSTSLRGHAAPA